MHAEQESLCRNRCRRLDIRHVAVLCTVRLIRMPHALFGLEEKHDQLFLAFLLIGDLPPVALTEQIVRRAAVRAEYKDAGGRFAHVLWDIRQHPPLFSAHRYGEFKRSIKCRTVGRVRITRAALKILIHFLSTPCYACPRAARSDTMLSYCLSRR